ncbi:tetratricopeptide repeat protein [Tuwongella immobilis]|uniref:Tol-pal system protein: Uncharacterized protein n=1 Tax=Tuwongella immobilis TaxID=692036 RepID=A0A6C2YS58_9BACT|nr:hypothetical protein [Tuwongella immobilis]VIP04306.1 tol-pal system protein : Uncharacterized protein OS=planctomycete KSU-1 GN=KSU1_D0729 PE=4 SV=1 [Tuwongella immobilis]VTS05975.1 tol-pal system protein : Uncharacterized protein OS=planctomycete KSU-1 GN=KSU1_D0729 PE=4 SV=1 [Tuwongella immobilis]
MTSLRRFWGPFCCSLLAISGGQAADPPASSSPDPSGGSLTTPPKPNGNVNRSEIELVENIIAARRTYQTTLEKLRTFYIENGDNERARWAEEELLAFHRILKQSYRLDVGDVPPPNMVPAFNVREANELYRRAMLYKDRGFGSDFLDNQRRAELLLQQLLTQYPRCDKISDAAYQLGDIYESRAFRQYRRAAAYFERSFQWSKGTSTDARLRAARIYDKSLAERARAIELYREVKENDTDSARIQEADRRLAELSAR